MDTHHKDIHTHKVLKSRILMDHIMNHIKVNNDYNNYNDDDCDTLLVKVKLS